MGRKRGKGDPAISYGTAYGHILSVLRCCDGCVHVQELAAEDVRELREVLGEMLSEVSKEEIAGVVRNQINGRSVG